MNKLIRSQIVLRAPRSFGLLALQFFAIPLLLTPLLMLSDLINLKILEHNTYPLGIIILLAFIIIIFDNRYRIKVIIYKNKELLIIHEYNKPTKEFNLSFVKKFVSNKISTVTGNQYKLLLINDKGERISLFDEKMIFSGKRWESFSLKLSSETKKPLVTDFYTEEYDGKLSQIKIPPPVGRNKWNKILLIYICISFVGALFTEIYSIRLESYIFLGMVTVTINIALTFYYIKRQPNLLNEWAYGFPKMIYVFSLMIPFTIFFILFVFAIREIKKLF